MDEGGVMSNGCIVKEDGRVLQELASNMRKPCNVCCRIEKFGNVVEGFCGTKRKWVGEMGFDGLLFLAGCRLPRSLCYWLATRVDCKKKELMSADGMKFPLSKVQVNWVYGLPHGPKDVPNKVKGKRMKAIVDQMWEMFGSTTPGGTKCITGKAIVDYVDKDPDDEIWFKRAFLMLALNEVLCPTTCYRLSVKLIPAVTVSSSAIEYDWCSLLLDHLFFYLDRFAKQFDRKGYVAGCGGCTHFLAVWYLDKLNRPPLCWGAFPRVKVWHNKEVNKAMAEDRIPNGDFGKIGCIDVAYGEAHPKSARDLYPHFGRGNGGTTNVDRAAQNFYSGPNRVYKKKKRNKATNGNPYARMINKRMREAAEQIDDGKGNGVESTIHRTGECRTDNAMVSHMPENSNLESDRCSPSTPILFGEVHERMMESENDVRPGVFEKDSLDPASPSLLEVGRVVERILGSPLGDSALHNETGSTPPPYGWGTLGVAPFSRLNQGKEDDPICDEESVDSPPQVTYVSEDNSDNDSDVSVHISLDPSPGFHTPNALGSTISERGGTASDGNCVSPEVHKLVIDREGTPSTCQRSLVQRVTKAPQKFSSHYLKAWRSSSGSRMKMKLSKVILKCLSASEVDPIVFECDGWSAHLSSVSVVLLTTGAIDVQYVSTAAKINTKVWAEKSVGRSKKIMFTPQFAIEALAALSNAGDVQLFCERHVHQLHNAEPRKINAIFVPVVEGRVWWAVAFSLNRREIRVMDPSGLLSEPHTACQYCLGSGVAMLMSFKSCEDRFNSTLTGCLDFKQRAWLLYEDLMSKHNSARVTCQDLISSSTEK